MEVWGAAQVGSRNKVEEVREVLYLLAVGYFRSQDYERSRSLCTQVLEVGEMGSFPLWCPFFRVSRFSRFWDAATWWVAGGVLELNRE